MTKLYYELFFIRLKLSKLDKISLIFLSYTIEYEISKIINLKKFIIIYILEY